MSKLYNVTPNALTGGGIFSILDSSAYDVPWSNDVIALQLDMEYYGNFSGDKVTSPLVDKLLEDGELTTAGMAQLAQVVYSLNFRRWDKEWQTQLAEYDPISNYDMTEEMSEEGSTQYGRTRLRTDNLAHTETRTDNLQHVVDASEVDTPAVTTTEQESVRAFNSGSDQPSTKRTQSASGTNRKDNDVTEHDTGTQSTTGSNTGTQSDAEGGEDTNAREYTLTRRGNIGVTTSQQMLSSERDLWMWNYFFEVVFPDVDKILTSPIYMIDAETAAAGGYTPEGEISINRNGIYNVSRYASALINVPNSYSAADEGKVVSNGELTAQTSRAIVANGEYNTTLNNLVNVNVPNSYTAQDEGKVVINGELVPQRSLIVTENGGYNTTEIYNLVVNVPGVVKSGITPPAASMGSDGDYYKQIFTLPNDVNFVEYLQSTGTQYIDTGILVSEGLDLCAKGVSIGQSLWVLGTRNASIIQDATVAMAVSFSGAGTVYCTKAFGIAHDILSLSISSGEEYEANIKTMGNPRGTKRVLQSAETVLAYQEQLNNISAATALYSIVLFGINTSGTITKSNGAKICRVTFFNNNVPLADYIPCIDNNNVACMWDNIAREYVYNDGTGDFSPGGSVIPETLEPILWVKQSGQWVLVNQ